MISTSLLRVLLTRSFKPFVFEGSFHNQLSFEDLRDLGLYVHIPFCRKLCGFCPYCKEIYDRQRAEAYKAALLKEIDLVCGRMTKSKEVTSLYFGGGTPALMIDDLSMIISKLKEYFIITGGIGVELHPSDINETNLQKLKKAGVTMVSIGIQSFHKSCLEKIGRSNDDFVQKIRLVEKYNFDVVDVDLIFAIPGQTDEILIEDILIAFENGATQVSTYPFIDFTYADNAWKPMSDKTKLKMLKHLVSTCKKRNIERTSVWTFAKPGTNKYSSVTRDSFLGFGISATSLLKDSFKINTFSIDAYIERINQGELPTSLTLDFTKRQRGVYYLFWATYGMDIQSDKFQEIMGQPLGELFGQEIYFATKLGLYKKIDSNRYEVTDRGACLYHHIEQVYTTAYIDTMWRVSRKTAFPGKIVLK